MEEYKDDELSFSEEVRIGAEKNLAKIKKQRLLRMEKKKKSYRYIDLDHCKKFGLDPDKVESIARRISRAAREADGMGITLVGGTGTGQLVFYTKERQLFENMIVAELDGHYDGGDPYGCIV